MTTELPLGTGQYARTNAAIWTVTLAATAFLCIRLWFRLRLHKLWIDDVVLSVSCLCLLSSSILLSVAMGAAGFPVVTPAQKWIFFTLHQTSTTLSSVATSWSKVAFALTLARLTQSQMMIWFLWCTIITANLVLVPGMLSIWFPGCRDPSIPFRPPTAGCFSVQDLKYMGGTFIVYGGMMDVLLALFPWLLIRNLRLRTGEKIGITICMSLGSMTGVVVILRAILNLRAMQDRYEGMVFLSIFNAIEPSITIIAQTLPILRVLLAGGLHRHTSTPTDEAHPGTEASQSELVRSETARDMEEMTQDALKSAPRESI